MKPKVWYHPKYGPFHHKNHTAKEGWYYTATYYTGNGSSEWGPYLTEAKALRARERHIQHTKWYQIWHHAMNNMPARTSHRLEWRVRNRPTPIGEFIKGEAQGKLILSDGQVLEMYKQPYHFGQQAALAFLMGYDMKRGGHNQMYVNMMRGSCPRDATKALLLQQFAHEGGTELARKMLFELGRPAHWYK